MSEMCGIIEKTIADVTVGPQDNCMYYIFTFTDGTVLKLTSWDYEDYGSGITVEVAADGI